MINLEDLTEADVGKVVNYIAPHGTEQYGIIKSWNEQFIFVQYFLKIEENRDGTKWVGERCGETAEGTRPLDLTFAFCWQEPKRVRDE
jgi:hypothetical protein